MAAVLLGYGDAFTVPVVLGAIQLLDSKRQAKQLNASTSDVLHVRHRISRSGSMSSMSASDKLEVTLAAGSGSGSGTGERLEVQLGRRRAGRDLAGDPRSEQASRPPR